MAALGEAPFDLVTGNGVLGWGIDALANAERPIVSLQALRPAAPPPFGVHRHMVPSPFEGTHTFLFYERA